MSEATVLPTAPQQRPQDSLFLLQFVISKKSILVESALGLLCAVFESGCLGEKVAAELLQEFRMNGSGAMAKPEMIVEHAQLVIQVLNVVKYFGLKYSSLLCSESKGSVVFIILIGYRWFQERAPRKKS